MCKLNKGKQLSKLTYEHHSLIHLLQINITIIQLTNALLACKS